MPVKPTSPLAWSGETEYVNPPTNPDYVFAGTYGPRNAKVLVVGDCYSQVDRSNMRPFSGGAGQLFAEICGEVGLNPATFLFTNVYDDVPQGGDMRSLVISTEKDAAPLRGLRPTAPLWKSLAKLSALVTYLKPQIIIACGDWALWALTEHAALKTDRGAKLPGGIGRMAGSHLFLSPHIAGDQDIPVLPTEHPSSILKRFPLRVAVNADLTRVARYLLNPDPKEWAGHREEVLDLYPDADTAVDILTRWLEVPQEIVCDIETYAQRIQIMGLCVGNEVLVVPFFHVKDGALVPAYTFDEFARIFALMRELFCRKGNTFIGQNFIYDTQYITFYFGVIPVLSFDTMIAQHIMFPALRGFKSLAAISRMWCPHHLYWKDERGTAMDAENLLASCNYNAKDLIQTKHAAERIGYALRENKLYRLLEERLAVHEVTTMMTVRGVAINNALRQRQLSELRVIEAKIEQWLNEVVPPHVRPTPPKSGTPWFRSPSQTATLLYKHLRFRPIHNPVSGGPATDKEALATLAGLYPHFSALFSVLLVYRSIGVLASNFLSSSLGLDMRTHTSYNLAGAVTFRLASSEGVWGGANLQNIPRSREPMDITKQDLA